MKLARVAATGTLRAVRKEAAKCGYLPGNSNAETLSNERERILLEQLPIVHLLARRIRMTLPRHVDIEDLVSAGILGLMDAFLKFDPAKNVPFRSYAQFRIRGAIMDSLRTLDWSPRSLRQKGRVVEAAIRALAQRMGCLPGDGEVAAELAMGLKEYQQLSRDLKMLEIGTLQMERNESGEDDLACLPAREEDNPLSICIQRDLKDRLLNAIANLPDRERLVSTLYYYLENTMREIALMLGVAESGVSHIHASAVTHLRTALKDRPVRKETAAAAKRPKMPLAA
jgi:RNA polymerase sigma factor for flagellar operon FliA